MSEWYCKQSGETSGPFTLDELEFLKDRGRLEPTDEVREGLQGQWQAASNVVLFAAAASTKVAAQKIQTASQPRQISKSQPETAPKAAGSAVPPQDGQSAHAMRATPVPPSPPRPLTDADTDAYSKRRRVMVGIGAGTGVALLILLLLLLLLSLRERISNTGGAQGEGTSVAGTGSGDGTGDGSDTGEKRNAGSTDEDHSGTQGIGSETGQEGAPDQGGDEPDPAGDEIPSVPESPSLSLAGTQNNESGGSGKAGSGGIGFGGGGGGGGDGIDFFGVKGKGSTFVYVVDCSGSMNGPRFAKACAELKRSVGKLRPHQKFYVYFFASSTYTMFFPDESEEKLIRASSANVKKLNEWIDRFNGSGGTEPKDAMLRALKLRPDTIFFLTDGGFDSSVVSEVRANNPRKKTSVNTIGFESRGGEANLKPIAEQNRGDYRFVP